jgi:hypothetical protein
MKINSKHEARNSKQIQMTKMQMTKTKTKTRRPGGKLLLFGVLNLWILDLFRISDFGFFACQEYRDGKRYI